MFFLKSSVVEKISKFVLLYKYFSPKFRSFLIFVHNFCIFSFFRLFFGKKSTFSYCREVISHRQQNLIFAETFAKMRKQKVLSQGWMNNFNFSLNVTLSVSRMSVLSAAWCSASRTMVSPSRLSSSSLSPESQRPPKKMPLHTDKKVFSSYIRKFRREPLQSHIMTNGLLIYG
jgi:hypothetical protein